jgi:hypothetical protein
MEVDMRNDPNIIGVTCDAEYLCKPHAIERYPTLDIDGIAHDSEGNEVHPVFDWDETPDGDWSCGECLYEYIMEAQRAS